MNIHNPRGKDIRFIDSHYNDLFRVADGGCIQIDTGNETVIKPCTFIDEYHTQIGNNVFHICEFAEVMERNGNTYQKEPEIVEDEAAWKVGRDKYLALQTCSDGYDYTIFDENFVEIDGGQLDMPELSMIEARTEILESYELAGKELRPMSYESLMELSEESGKDVCAEMAIKLNQFVEDFDPYEYHDQVSDAEAHIDKIESDLRNGCASAYVGYLEGVIKECDEDSMRDVAMALKSELEKFDKKPSVLAQLSQKCDVTEKVKSHKHTEQER